LHQALQVRAAGSLESELAWIQSLLVQPHYRRPSAALGVAGKRESESGPKPAAPLALWEAALQIGAAGSCES
jgi:hypothetical protein